MKNWKTSTLIMVLCLNIGIVGCSNAQKSGTTNSEKKILIVYLSRTKNTEAVAQMIHNETGGKMVAIELIDPYPKDYKAQVEQVVRENEKGYLPPLKTKVDSIGHYDVIFIGFPTWDMKIPPPVKSFLNQYDLAGKTVIPFNTNAGYGVGSGFQTVKDFCPKSVVLEGFSTQGGIERDGILYVMKGNKANKVRNEVQKWLKKLKLEDNEKH